ncbi:MAG: DUF3276 family protein [Candidatus Lokiarchaeota archaeon]|nr:DUF3276 family protein [Candidatus Lokiarchaeota archaeon]
MSNYKVEKVEIRERKNGEKYLQLKLCDNSVGFFEKEDIGTKMKEGDIISCKIVQKGKFFNGTNLKVLDKVPADLKIEKKLKFDHKPDPKSKGFDRKSKDYGSKFKGNDSKLHAGARIYYFEIKNTSKGDKYLVITEQSGDKRNRIFIFEDHAVEFSDKLTHFLTMLKKN